MDIELPNVSDVQREFEEGFRMKAPAHASLIWTADNEATATCSASGKRLTRTMILPFEVFFLERFGFSRQQGKRMGEVISLSHEYWLDKTV